MTKPSEKAAALGNYIKERSKERGISRRELASTLDIDVKSVKLVETGEGLLSFSQITKVSELLDIPLETILKDCGIWGD